MQKNEQIKGLTFVERDLIDRAMTLYKKFLQTTEKLEENNEIIKKVDKIKNKIGGYRSWT